MRQKRKTCSLQLLVIDEADIKLMYLVSRSEREDLRGSSRSLNKCAVAPVELIG